MVCKEEVIFWFRKLSGYQRIDMLCSLLQLCLPFEMKYLATFIEGHARTDFEYHQFRQVELDVNDAGTGNTSEESGSTSLTQQASANVTHPFTFKGANESLLDVAFRRKLVLSIAFLHANNRSSAAALYDHLVSPAAESALYLLNVNLYPIIQLSSSNPEMPRQLAGMDECLQQLLLLYTLAVHHPAFNFEEKKKLSTNLVVLQAMSQPCLAMDPSRSNLGSKSESVALPLEGPIPILNGISRLSPIQIFQDPAKNSEPYSHISTEISPDSSNSACDTTSPTRYLQRPGSTIGDVLNHPPSLPSPITSSPTSPFQSPLSSPNSPKTQGLVTERFEGSGEPQLNKENLRKFWPSLQQFSPNELKSFTDEELRVLGLSPTCIPKLRQFLRNAIILPNGMCASPKSGTCSPANTSTGCISASDIPQMASVVKKEYNGLPEVSVPPPLRRNSRESYPSLSSALPNPNKHYANPASMIASNPSYVSNPPTSHPRPHHHSARRHHDPSSTYESAPSSISVKPMHGLPNMSVRHRGSYGAKSDSSVSVGSGSNSSTSSIDSPSPPGSRIGSPGPALTSLPGCNSSVGTPMGSRSPFLPPPAEPPNIAYPALIPGPMPTANTGMRTAMTPCAPPNPNPAIRQRFFEPFPLAPSLRPRILPLHNVSAGNGSALRVSAPKSLRTVGSAPLLQQQGQNSSNEAKGKYKAALNNPCPPCLNGSVRFANPPTPSSNSSSGNASRASSESREVPPQSYIYPVTRIPFSMASYVYSNPHNISLATSESNTTPTSSGGGGTPVNLAFMTSPPFMPPPSAGPQQQPPPPQGSGQMTQMLPLSYMESTPISSSNYSSTNRSHGLMPAPLHPTMYAYPQYSFICDTSGEGGGAPAGGSGQATGLFYGTYPAGFQYILPPSMPPPPGNAPYVYSPYYLGAPVLNSDMSNAAGTPNQATARPLSVPETGHGQFLTSLEPPAGSRLYCYNCGAQGHRGPECKETTIEECIKPTKPDS